MKIEINIDTNDMDISKVKFHLCTMLADIITDIYKSDRTGDKNRVIKDYIRPKFSDKDNSIVFANYTIVN